MCTDPRSPSDGKEYQAGDRVLCLDQRAQRRGQQRHPRRGHRGGRRAADAHLGARRSSPGGHRHHAVRRHRPRLRDDRAQGPGDDRRIALVVGSDGATREWTYTAMSRGTEATHYYAVAQPPERDTPRRRALAGTSRSAEERIVHSWSSLRVKELALDYPERYETPERITVEDDLRALATDRQRALVEVLSGSEVAQEATRVEAGEEIDRLVAQRAYDHVERLLRERGMSEGQHASGSPARWSASTRRTPPAVRGTISGGRPSPVSSRRDRCAARAAQLAFERAGDVTRRRAVERLANLRPLDLGLVAVDRLVERHISCLAFLENRRAQPCEASTIRRGCAAGAGAPRPMERPSYFELPSRPAHFAFVTNSSHPPQ